MALVLRRDYPGSYLELLVVVPDDEACLDYLDWLRWPDGWPVPRVRGRARL